MSSQEQINIIEKILLDIDDKDMYEYNIAKILVEKCYGNLREFAERLKERFAYDIERCNVVDELLKEYSDV